MLLKSLLFMEKEKLLILRKELTQPYLICDFYGNDNINTNDASAKKDLEEDFNKLKEEIKNLRERIKNNFFNLEKQIDFLKINKNKYEIEALIYLDILREYIGYEIDNIGKVNRKIAQLLRDGYNQYIPKPMLGKRFSSVNITSQVELSLTNRLRDNSHTKEAMLLWDYTQDYRILKQKNYNKFYLPFWYFEMSYFLPSLTHELGHLINNNQKLKQEINIAINKVQKEYELKSNYPINKKQLIVFNNMAEEVNADINAYIYHGKSYFYALFHSLIGKNLHKFFKTNANSAYYKKNHKIEIINVTEVKLDSFDFEFRPFYIEEKRDSTFIRLYLLLEIEKGIIEYFKYYNDKKEFSEKYKISLFQDKKDDKKDDDDENKKIKEEKKLLNSIYNIDNIEFNNFVMSDLGSIFNLQQNKTKDIYIDTFNIVKAFCDNLKDTINKHIFRIYLKTKQENAIPIDEDLKDIPYHFNHLWERKFEATKQNKLLHRFIYRKKLHFDTIKKLIEDKYLTISSIKPFSMVFMKYKLTNSAIYDKKLEGDDIVTQGVVIGIYDYIYIRKLDAVYNKKIEEEFKYEEFEDVKYYELKHSLMKILDDIKGEEKEDNYISTIIQVEVPKNNKGKEIYEDLTRDLKKIKDIFSKENKKDYKNIEFFKSLGPKDVIIHIDCSNLDFIFKIKKKLAEEFNRTFTTLYIDREKEDKLIATKTNIFVTKLRMNQEYNNQEYMKLLNNNINYIEKIELITGSMDYVITWKQGITFSKLMEFYNNLLGSSNMSMVSDIQTSIARKINPIEEIKQPHCKRI